MTKSNHKLFHARRVNTRKRQMRRSWRIAMVTAIVTVLTTISLVAVARGLKNDTRDISAKIVEITNNGITLMTSDGNLWQWCGDYDIDVTNWNNSYTVTFDCNGTEDVIDDSIIHIIED